ncbi:hypothetical protein [Macrococcus sp. S115]|uniref:hypothetical protein n=1 Tax=Macrococcus sp. S115 TaxID=3047480 RepID=UPI0024BC9936|nr:hypothetical protein [Macrococcus sp. S115]MDJ1111454.1 hypothetical protein [Macrococcus sp. S115]
MTYRNKRINRHVHARKPVNSEFEEREQRITITKRAELKEFKFGKYPNKLLEMMFKGW